MTHNAVSHVLLYVSCLYNLGNFSYFVCFRQAVEPT